MVFFSAYCFSSTLLIDDRLRGLWNRMILTGVRVTEVYVAVTIVTMVFLSFAFVSTVIGFSISSIEFKGSIPLLTAFYLLFAFCGTMFGLCSASLFQTQGVSDTFLFGLANCANFLAG